MASAVALPDEDGVSSLLQPYVDGLELPSNLYAACTTFLALLLRWNARMNLTAVRDPEQLIQRQLGESLFAARIAPRTGSLLDFGSGAGFPGIPLQLASPHLRVTLAESQGKKAGFLREAVRSLALGSTVWAERVEAMPTSHRFDCVTLRAVDRSEAMLQVAAPLVANGGSLLLFTGREAVAELAGWMAARDEVVPGNVGRLVQLRRV